MVYEYIPSKTVKKGLFVFLEAAVPAGLLALAGLPELVIWAPVIAGAIEAFRNWIKHRND